MNKERKLEIDILSLSSSPRHVTVICDKFVLATRLTSEPNLPCIYGMDWASSSAPPNLHAKDVGTYCRNHLGYQPIPDKCQDKKQELDHVEPPSTKQPLRSVAIYEANKTFFDSVHLVASLHRHPSRLHLDIAPSDPVQVHWIVREGPEASWMAAPGPFLPNKQPAPSDQAASTRLMSLMNLCLNKTPKTISVRSSSGRGLSVRIEGS